MNKKQQLKQQIEQLAQKFGYEIKELDFSHNTEESFGDDNYFFTEFDMVSLKMTTTDFSDTIVEDIDDDNLRDMRTEFYRGIVNSNVNLLISTMFDIAKEGGTDLSWKMYVALLASLQVESLQEEGRLHDK